jgi:hypothetical protein
LDVDLLGSAEVVAMRTRDEGKEPLDHRWLSALSASLQRLQQIAEIDSPEAELLLRGRERGESAYELVIACAEDGLAGGKT